MNIEQPQEQPKSALQEILQYRPNTLAALDLMFNEGVIEGSLENFITKVQAENDVKETIQIIEEYMQASKEQNLKAMREIAKKITPIFDRL